MTDDFNPFGDEWRLEMNKWTKSQLIDYLRKTLMDLQVSKQQADIFGANLTQEELDILNGIDWSNKTLRRVLRISILHLKHTDVPIGLEGMMNMVACYMMIETAIKNYCTDMGLEIRNHTDGVNPLGDWLIEVKRINKQQ